VEGRRGGWLCLLAGRTPRSCGEIEVVLNYQIEASVGISLVGRPGFMMMPVMVRIGVPVSSSLLAPSVSRWLFAGPRPPVLGFIAVASCSVMLFNRLANFFQMASADGFSVRAESHDYLTPS
jgi:hypothetical protein